MTTETDLTKFDEVPLRFTATKSDNIINGISGDASKAADMFAIEIFGRGTVVLTMRRNVTVGRHGADYDVTAGRRGGAVSGSFQLYERERGD